MATSDTQWPPVIHSGYHWYTVATTDTVATNDTVATIDTTATTDTVATIDTVASTNRLLAKVMFPHSGKCEELTCAPGWPHLNLVPGKVWGSQGAWLA